MATNSFSSKHSDATRILLDAVRDADMVPYQAKVAQRIEDLEDEIMALKGCHNAVTPACRLPPEVLANTFMILSDIVRSYHGHSWFRVTQVCRHWRSIALDCTSLWSNLQFVNPKFAEYMLRHSRAAPLTVCFSIIGIGSGKQREFEPVLSKALCQLDRLKDVDICAPSYFASATSAASADLEPVLAAIANWHGAAPDLERLALRIGKERWPAPLPLGFLQVGTPLLHTLAIEFCGITWAQVPLGPRLTHLILQEQSRDDPHRPSVDMFLASLREMPMLHRMQLEGFAPRLPETNNSIPDVPLTMPFLTILKIEDLPDNISLLFRILHFHDFKEVQIFFGYRDEAPPHSLTSIRQALASIKQSYGRDGDIHKGIQRLHMSGYSDEDPSFALCFDAHETEDRLYSASLKFEF